MKLESAQRLKDRLLSNCQIMDWDENIVQFLDEEESIPGVEASGYKILVSYKGISLKDKICIERTLQSLEFGYRTVEWKGGNYLAIYTIAG